MAGRKGCPDLLRRNEPAVLDERMRLGDLEGGVVASAFTPTVSVVSGGLLCLGGVAVIALMVPRFARWRIGDPP